MKPLKPLKPLKPKQVQRLRELMVDSDDAPVNNVYKSRGRSRIIGTGNVQSARLILQQQDEIDRLQGELDAFGDSVRNALREAGEG